MTCTTCGGEERYSHEFPLGTTPRGRLTTALEFCEPDRLAYNAFR
jgi:hypothetical protein